MNIPSADYEKIRRAVPRHVVLGCRVGGEFVMNGNDAKEASVLIGKDWSVEDDRMVLRIRENDMVDAVLSLLEAGRWIGVVDKRKEPSKWCGYEVKAIISSKDELGLLNICDE